MQLKLRYGDQEIPITLIYRQRKTIGIRVEPPDSVYVFAPMGIDPDQVLANLAKKGRWISQTLERLAAGAASLQDKEYREGEIFLFQGKEYPLHLTVNERVRRPSARLAGSVLAVVTPVPGREAVRSAVLAWYFSEVEAAIRARVEHYRRSFPPGPTRVIIKDFKGQWGNCSSDNVLRFNWRLVLAPPAVLDYVVVHEMSHLIHKNHSPAFWEQVAAIAPDYREQRSWLKENGWKLHAGF